MIHCSHLILRRGLLLASVLLGSCVQVNPKPDFHRARNLIEESTGRQEIYDPYVASPSEAELGRMLADGLSLEEALRIALLNNRELQAEFQEIGIAHADWVQSRLLANPSLDLFFRFPTGGGRSLLEASAGTELLEFWRLPARSEAAKQGLEATILRIARRAGERLAETRNAYFAAVAAEQLFQLSLESVELATRSFAALNELHAAGAADALDLCLAEGPLLAAQLEQRATRIDARNAKRELAKWLSLEHAMHDLVLSDALPEPASEKVDAEALVQRALETRLDLRAIQSAIKALESRLQHERRKAWGDARGAITSERPALAGDALIGPGLSLTLPLFDQNQAQVARAEFELEQMIKLNESARIAVAQDMRTAADRLNAALEGLAFYAQEVLPQANRSLLLAQESVAAGQTTLLALGEVERLLLDARRAHLGLRLEAAYGVAPLLPAFTYTAR